MIKTARWRVLNPEVPPVEVGYRMPTWCGPQLSWSDVADEYLAAKDDPTRLGDFMRSVCCRPFDPTILEAGRYEDRQGTWSRDQLEIPADVIEITAGVDVGVAELWLVVVGWGIGGRKFVLWSARIPRGPGIHGFAEAWRKTDERARLPEHRSLAGDKPTLIAGICDSGYETDLVYEGCRTFPGWLPAKGDPRGRAVYQMTHADPERKHRGRYSGMRLVLHSTHILQEMLENALATPITESGGIEFAMDEGKRMWDHLRGCVRKIKPDGSTTWDKAHKGAHDHLRDALQLAILAGIIAKSDRLEKPKEPIKKERAEKEQKLPRGHDRL
jgi:phage terminase large subunit GpA-like protein